MQKAPCIAKLQERVALPPASVLGSAGHQGDVGERSGAGPYDVMPAAGQKKMDSAYTQTASACCGALGPLDGTVCDVELTLGNLKLEV